ncbi:hypothetical protein D3C81_1026420 [compost metagenome]
MIATAVIPLNARPTPARIARRYSHFVVAAEAKVNRDAANKAITITFFLPQESESGPVKKSPRARKIVEIESIKLD